MSRELPEGWAEFRIEEILYIKRGVTWDKKNELDKKQSDAIPVISIPNIQEQLQLNQLRYIRRTSIANADKFVARSGWTLMVGSNGNPARVGNCVYASEVESYLFASFLLGIYPKNTSVLFPEYGYRILSSRFIQDAISASVQGTTGLRNISVKMLRDLVVMVPPLNEQRRIAEILSSVDDAIAATQAVIEQTKKVKQATLERLLTKGIGHTRFKQTEIGEIPESWDFAELNSVATLQPGYAFKSNQFVDEGVRLLRGSNVGVGSFDWSEGTTKYFPKDRVVEFSEYFLHENDIIIAMDRPFISSGFKVARLQKSDLPCLLLQRVGRLTPKVNCSPDWLWQITSAGSVRSHLEKQQVGTDLPHISKSDIESCKIAIPTLSEQKEIASILTPFDVNIEILMKNLHTSKIMKSALLSDLLTGRKRLTDTLPLAAE